MSPETLIGVFTLAAGALITALSVIPARTARRRSQQRFAARLSITGTGFDAVHTGTGQRFPLTLSGGPQALHDGDVIDVVPNRDGSAAMPYYRIVVLLSYGYLAEGVLVMLVGVACLVSGVRDGLVTDAGDVVSYLGPVLFCLSAAPLAVAMLLSLLRSLVGSRRVHGTVIDVRDVVTPKKMTYQPLVEYHAPGGMRRAWGAARWRRPELGSAATVRVSERAQGLAITSSPLVVAGLVLLLLMGGVGLAGLGILVAATRLVTP